MGGHSRHQTGLATFYLTRCAGCAQSQTRLAILLDVGAVGQHTQACRRKVVAYYL